MKEMKVSGPPVWGVVTGREDDNVEVSYFSFRQYWIGRSLLSERHAHHLLHLKSRSQARCVKRGIPRPTKMALEGLPAGSFRFEDGWRLHGTSQLQSKPHLHPERNLQDSQKKVLGGTWQIA